jgi:prephenate dehydrogenase
LSALKLRQLTVVGVGLIGGSFALALKQAGVVARVVGLGRSRANLERAVQRGVIDEIATEPRAAVSGSDFVLIAVPVQQTERMLREIAPHLTDDCVVTDSGSTKQDVVAAARAALGTSLDRFVPAHPIAGAELSGVEAASATLYRNRLAIVTPLPETSRAAQDKVEAAWRACGARVLSLTPDRHDAVFAAVSHLPHALAFALVDMIASREDAAELFSFAGAGFRDFTRIASSSPEMWRDICLANRDALLREIEAYRVRLGVLAEHIARGDAPGVEQVFESARTARNRWLQEQGDK